MDKLYFNIAGYHPPSTNDSYVPTSGKPKMGKNGRMYRGAFFRKSNWLQDYQKVVAEMIESEVHHTKEEIEQFSREVLEGGHGILCEIRVSMPKRSYGWKSLSKNDASNYIKPTEDALFSHLDGVDDKYTVTVVCSKFYNENQEWFVDITLTKTSTAWNKLNINREEVKVYEYSDKK